MKFATGPVGQALIGEVLPVRPGAAVGDQLGWISPKRTTGSATSPVLTEGPAHSEGLPVTPAWEKIVALMDRNIGPVLRGTRPATSLTGLSRAVDEVLRSP